MLASCDALPLVLTLVRLLADSATRMIVTFALDMSVGRSVGRSVHAALGLHTWAECAKNTLLPFSLPRRGEIRTTLCTCRRTGAAEGT